MALDCWRWYYRHGVFPSDVCLWVEERGSVHGPEMLKCPTKLRDSVVQFPHLFRWIVSKVLWLSNAEDSILAHQKILEMIVPAYGIETRFSYTRRILFSTLVKILKQWMQFCLLVPYAEIYPRKITSEIVMEKNMYNFSWQQNRVTNPSWLAGAFPFFSTVIPSVLSKSWLPYW